MSLPTTARGWNDLGQAISRLKMYMILETVLYMLFTLSILFLAGFYVYAMSIIN